TARPSTMSERAVYSTFRLMRLAHGDASNESRVSSFRGDVLSCRPAFVGDRLLACERAGAGEVVRRFSSAAAAGERQGSRPDVVPDAGDWRDVRRARADAPR